MTHRGEHRARRCGARRLRDRAFRLRGRHPALNQEAAKALARGRAAGLDISPEHAIRWLTANPARALASSSAPARSSRQDGRRRALEPRPFSVYALADEVYIDGALEFDRRASSATRAPTSCWASRPRR